MIELEYQEMETAPKDREILIKTENGEVKGKWDSSQIDLYKSMEGGASYDPENMYGTWVSDEIEGEDKRLFCGDSPQAWRPAV